MSAKRDYYEVIGVTKTSSQDEIKSQYRKLALKFHPDRNKSPEAAEHFKEISEAYAVLADPKNDSCMISMDMLVWMDDTVLRIFSEAPDLTLTTLVLFLKISLEEEDRDLAVLEDKEALTYYMKLLFRLRMCLTEKEWILIYKKM